MDSLFLAFAVLIILFWGVVLYSWASVRYRFARHFVPRVQGLPAKVKEFFRNG